MAITRGATIGEFRRTTAPDITTVDETEVIDANTTLSILTLHCAADDTLSEEPTWDDAGVAEEFVLIRDVVSGSDAGDSHTLIYGLASPTAKTAVVDYTYASGVDGPAHVLINYLGTISSSVAAATNFLSEDINNGITSTNVHASAGTSGATLLFAGSHVSAAGNPSSNNASFTELADNDSFTSSSGNAYYVADLIGGAPSAITVTWATSNENTGALIEILPALEGSLGRLIGQSHSNLIGQGSKLIGQRRGLVNERKVIPMKRKIFLPSLSQTMHINERKAA